MHGPLELSPPLSILESILSELQALRLEVQALQASGPRRRVAADYLSLREAAASIGRSVRAVQHLLARDAADANGVHPRRIRGAVHRGDWARFVESRCLRGRGEAVRRALEIIG